MIHQESSPFRILYYNNSSLKNYTENLHFSVSANYVYMKLNLRMCSGIRNYLSLEELIIYIIYIINFLIFSFLILFFNFISFLRKKQEVKFYEK